MRRSSLVALLVPSFAFPGLAHADSFTVGASGDFTSLAEAIAAANASGVASDITIDSTTYAGNTGEDPYERINVPLVITSTGTAATTAPIGALFSIEDLEVSHLTIRGGDVHFRGDGGYTSASPPLTIRTISDSNNGPGSSGYSELFATDVVLEPGEWEGPAVYSNDAYVNLDGFDIRGFFYGPAFELRGEGLDLDDDDRLDGVSFDLANGIVASTGTSSGRAGGIYVPFLDHGTVTDVTFSNVARPYTPIIFTKMGQLDITDSTFDGGEGHTLEMQSGGKFALTMTGSTISNRTDTTGQIQITVGDPRYDYGGSVWSDVDLYFEDVLFDSNIGWDGSSDLAIDVPATTVTMIDSIIRTPQADGSGYVGSLAGYGDWLLERVSFEGTGQFAPVQGGAIAFFGSTLQAIDCTFDGFASGIGGAVLLSANEGSHREMVAQFDGGSFTNNSAFDAGGAVLAFGGVRATFDGTTFTSNTAQIGGTIAAGSEIYCVWCGVEDIAGVSVTLRDVTASDSVARMGGFLYAGGLDGSIHIADSTISDSHAVFAGGRFGAGEGAVIGGSGGVIAAQLPLGSITVSGSTFSGNTADRYGGVLMSLHDVLFEGNGGGEPALSEALDPTGGFHTVCEPSYGQGYDPYGIGTGGVGAAIAFDGNTIETSQAKLASVAFVAPFDEASFVGNQITGNVADQDATFLSWSASRFDLSCNDFCGNEVDGHGSAAYLFDLGAGRGAQHFVDYRIENNTFVGNTDGGDGNVVGFNFCDDPEQAQGDVSERTGQVTSLPLDTGGSGPSAPRGQLLVWNNTFTGGSGDLASRDLQGRSRDVRLSIGNNVFQAADTAVDLEYSYYVDADFNLYDDVTTIGANDAALFVPEPTAVLATPSYFAFTPDQCFNRLFLVPESPGFDGGDPHLSDWDGSRSDIGAFGGAGACPRDLDNDGFHELADCDDDERNTFPGGNETPYDTIDQDCDGFDFCDADHDGFDSDACPGGTDCDDGNANVNPEGTDLYANGIDEDCDAHDFCDRDNDLFRAVVCGGEDCNDDRADFRPGAIETPYNDIDEDCDGEDLCDLDRDGVASDDVNCGGTDCNDADAFTYPAAPEIPYDTVDQDCDGDDWCDVDGDGFDSIRCGGDDCDDDRSDVHPGATETHNNGIDEDCDGEDDCDADDDGVWNLACGGEDCDDTDATISPLADEVAYDGIDQDCDDADSCDVDGDGELAPECGGNDCDDTDPGSYPGAPEAPDDGVDQDCNGEDLYPIPPGGCGACEGSTTGTEPWSVLAGLGLGLALMRRRRASEAVPVSATRTSSRSE